MKPIWKGFMVAAAIHLAVFLPLRIWLPGGGGTIPGLDSGGRGGAHLLTLTTIPPGAPAGGADPLESTGPPASLHPPEDTHPPELATVSESSPELAHPVPVPDSSENGPASAGVQEWSAGGDAHADGGAADGASGAGASGAGAPGAGTGGIGSGGGGDGALFIPPVPRRITWPSAEGNDAGGGSTRTVRILVQEDGTVLRAEIVSPEASGVAAAEDSLVISAAMLLRFQPALLNGRPVSAWTTMEIAVNRGSKQP